MTHRSFALFLKLDKLVVPCRPGLLFTLLFREQYVRAEIRRCCDRRPRRLRRRSEWMGQVQDLDPDQ